MSGPSESSLEREKWEAEKQFRERELCLKEREQRFERWRSPLLIAIVGATIAAVANLIIHGTNARHELNLEATKAKDQMDLQQRDAESDRILEALKTSNPEKTKINLQFLLDSGLITQRPLKDNLKGALAGIKPGQEPSIGSATVVLPREPVEPEHPPPRFPAFRCDSQTAVVRETLADQIGAILKALDYKGIKTRLSGSIYAVTAYSEPTKIGDRLAKQIAIRVSIIPAAGGEGVVINGYMDTASQAVGSFETTFSEVDESAKSEVANHFSSTFGPGLMCTVLN